MKQVFTLAFIRKENQILLARKLKKIGAGYWNGFGGKVEAGETIEEAAIRECREEINVVADSAIHRGILSFSGEAYDKPIAVHVFEISEFSGTPTATLEMGEPTWFALDNIPYDQMWEDDAYWLPMLLEGKCFRGAFEMDEEKRLVRHKIEVIADNELRRFN
ncbi:MAG: 8-oxo-dGTP diphosphatase, partial [Candidatus Andersenbacteria bacterium]